MPIRQVYKEWLEHARNPESLEDFVYTPAPILQWTPQTVERFMLASHGSKSFHSHPYSKHFFFAGIRYFNINMALNWYQEG